VIQVAPQMRLLVAVKPVDFRKGIDGLAGICRQVLGSDPFSGAVFVFRNRRQTDEGIYSERSAPRWGDYRLTGKVRFEGLSIAAPCDERGTIEESPGARRVSFLLSQGGIIL